MQNVTTVSFAIEFEIETDDGYYCAKESFLQQLDEIKKWIVNDDFFELAKHDGDDLYSRTEKEKYFEELKVHILKSENSMGQVSINLDNEIVLGDYGPELDEGILEFPQSFSTSDGFLLNIIANHPSSIEEILEEKKEWLDKVEMFDFNYGYWCG
ncbi:MAG: hypothetical protein SCARUB_02795 [Candidatus Scalindua rubra]|uniref:Uncharacterized protein n=1 Tax=Candidatus Scalindua rubra TaxID=1872076 RepID=A0A1E3X901_9BACT|nr:MAG: hypothetical protein SCARUB_02795 [Candidatus Scalindua rubra]